MQKSHIRKVASELVKDSNLDRKGRDGYLIPQAIVAQLSDDVKLEELLQILERLDVQDDLKASWDIIVTHLQLIQLRLMKTSFLLRPAYETLSKFKATTSTRPQPFRYSSGPYP